MEMQGEQLIRAPQQRVWEALNDAQILAKCIPGCEEIKRLSDTESDVRMLAKIGPVRARFSGRILMSEITVPTGCTLTFEGNGGAAGMAKGSSKVALEAKGDDTRLVYSVAAAVGGKLGQIGGRLIDASAKKMADDFFYAFNEQLAAKGIARAEAGETPLPGPPLPRAPSEAKAAAAPFAFAAGWSGEFQRVFWMAIGAGVAVLVARLLAY